MQLILSNYSALHFQTTKTIAPLNLFHWLDALSFFPKVYWKSKDVEIAAVGKILEFEKPPIFDPANQSTARFFGGKAFSKPQGLWDSFPPSIFFLPAFEIIQQKEKTVLLIHSLEAYQQEIPLFSPHKKPSLLVLSRKDEPSYSKWEQLVTDFLHNKKGIEKLVLARQTTLELSKQPAPFHLLSQIEQPSGTLFGLQFSAHKAFIGATPEKLYQRRNREIFSEAIAGTHPNIQQLSKSRKDKREFQFVKDYIREALNPLCKTLQEGEDRFLKAANVHHLHCPFHGVLKEMATDAMLLDALHPTPAVNGFPKESALDYLRDVEPFDRGWYASALGYLSQQEADFAVGIRSALIEGTHIHLYAGGGLVEGSSAAAEWDEREQKIALFKKIFKEMQPQRKQG